MNILIVLPKISYLSNILKELEKSFDFLTNKKKDIITITKGLTVYNIYFVQDSKTFSKTNNKEFKYVITYGRSYTPEWIVKNISNIIKGDN